MALGSRRPNGLAPTDLLGSDGGRRALDRESRRIRDGSLDDRIDAVRAHVRATVREKLLVANPGYLPDEPSA